MRIQQSTLCGAFLTLATLAGLPSDSSAQPAGPTVLVLLQNDAGVPSNVAATAQAEVVRLYGLIGVEVAWVADVPEPGRRLRVVSLVSWDPADDLVPASALGVTHGDRAYVFWRQVELTSQKFTASVCNLLAIAIAHELGHTLIRHGSHAKEGLMEASWNSGHFRSASAGLLTFSSESAALILRGLMDEATVARRGVR